MHAKKLDKLATAVLYTIAGIIVTILASLILYILVRGLQMCIRDRLESKHEIISDGEINAQAMITWQEIEAN